MRRLTFYGIGITFALTLIIGFWNAPAVAQEPPLSPLTMQVAGSANFDQYCVVCHGKDARGTGPLAASLSRKPADLTGLSKRNGGTFPQELVFDVIDGSKKIKGHGGGDMPEWGDAFRRSAESPGPDAAKKRIETLVSFLASIQKN